MSVVGCKQVEDEEWYILKRKGKEKKGCDFRKKKDRKKKARNREGGGVDGLMVVGGDKCKGGGAGGKNIDEGEG